MTNPFHIDQLDPNGMAAAEILKGGPGSGRKPSGSTKYDSPAQIAGKNVPGQSKKVFVAGRNGVFRSNLNSKWHKEQYGDTLRAIKAAFSKLPLRSVQRVLLAKGSPDESKVICKHCGGSMDQPSPGEKTADGVGVEVEWNPKTKDFVRNSDGSVAGRHYYCGWGATMQTVMDLGRKINYGI